MTETVKLKDRHPWRSPVSIMTALNIVRGYAALWGINLSGTWETAGVLALVLLSLVFDLTVIIPKAESKTTPLADPRDNDGNRLTRDSSFDRFNTAVRDLATKLEKVGFKPPMLTIRKPPGSSSVEEDAADFQRHREHLEHILSDPEVRDEMEEAPEWLQDLLDAQEGSEVPDELEDPES